MTPTEAAGRLGYYLDQIEICAGDVEEVRRYVAEARAIASAVRLGRVLIGSGARGAQNDGEERRS